MGYGSGKGSIEMKGRSEQMMRAYQVAKQMLAGLEIQSFIAFFKGLRSDDVAVQTN